MTDETTITPRRAANLIKVKLLSMGFHNRVSAKTVGFSDLARTSAIFVTVHDWQPNPKFSELKEVAKKNGFFVEGKGGSVYNR